MDFYSALMLPLSALVVRGRAGPLFGNEQPRIRSGPGQ